MISELNNRITGLCQDDGTPSVCSFVVTDLKKRKQISTASTSKPVDRQISFQSDLMVSFVELAQTYAQSSAAVIVAGESGTGKELFSRFIHQQSDRSAESFVAVNCAALSESLIESEFFGHEKGAFTGAETTHVGHFERASGGTILLDEISEIPLSIQAKLLRVIEEQEVLSVGGNRPRPIDVRIIATTNRDLKQEVAENRFRADLYHRLNVLELNLPPLRDRVADIPLLVMNFVSKFQGESKVGSLKVDSDAMRQICDYHWPGNVRQLRNVIHRACVVCSNDSIGVSALPTILVEPAEEATANSFFGMKLADVERRLILAAIQKYEGNKRQAADELGVTARTLSNKLRIYSQLGVS
jgi:DNA-binding NtrC family response regulator